MRRHFLRFVLSALRQSRAYLPTAIVLLAVAMVATGPLAFFHEASITRQRIAWHEALYYTLGLFTFQSNHFGYPTSVLLRFHYFLAPTVTASAILGAFAKLLEERAPLLLRRFRHHTVIGGLGHLGGAIARDQHRHRGAFIAIERDGSAPEVAHLRSSVEGAVLVGDMTSPELLRRARCHLARRVFLTAQADIVNLDAAFLVRRLAHRAGVRHPPTIYAHVYDPGLSDALDSQLRAHDLEEADIITFNSYRFAAKALLAQLFRDRLVRSLRLAPGITLERTPHPAAAAMAAGGAAASRTARSRDPQSVPRPEALLEDRRLLLASFRLGTADDSHASETPDRFAIVGLGRFGRSVASELLRSAPAPSRFLVIERSAATYQTQMESFLPEERLRFEVAIGDATHADAVARIHAFAPTAVIICTDNDLGNLRLALDLHRRAVKTVTRMFDLDAGLELSRGLEERGIATVGLARLFRAAIPILTHERRLVGCVDVAAVRDPMRRSDATPSRPRLPHDRKNAEPAPDVDHLFYLARLTAGERAELGESCVRLGELEAAPGAPPPPADFALVWYPAVKHLSSHVPTALQ